ncbi:hypothetical protein [Comamonas squillarum]|uniref:Secreted protein n=1 Tax=Comamonas squillarum TaxID=2977320 RepID=A0ABY6A5W5_9BURK|nr:hypothetical protein [Comamonas sp. PR12]UXC20505.1 hypothetical protein N4T19_10520 [Comamonas sp. PR12]
MRPIYTSLLIAGLLSASAAAVSHTAQPPSRPAPPSAAVQQEASNLQGTVQQWLLNPNGDVDGFLLADGQMLTQVVFAPHLSAALLQAAAIGETVRVSGWPAPGLPLFSASRVTGMRTGRSVVDTPPELGEHSGPGPVAAAALSAMETSGQIKRLLYSRRGEAHGVVLDGGDIVRFAPHQAPDIMAYLQVGQPLFVRGWGLRNDYGQSIEATAIGPNAQAMQALFAKPEDPLQRDGETPGLAHGPGPVTAPPRP